MASTSRKLEVAIDYKDNVSASVKKSLAGITGFSKAGGDSMRQLEGRVLAVKAAIVGVGAGLAAYVTSGVVRKVAELGDELAKTATRTGISVESLSKLKFASEQSGSSLQELTLAVLTLQKNIGQFAVTGGGRAADAIKFLGKEFGDAVKQGVPVERLLVLISQRLAGLENAEQRVFVAQKLFGDSGARLLPLLRAGRLGIEELTKQAERLGIVWSETDAKAAEEFGDALNRLKSSVQGAIQGAIKPLLPAITELFDEITQAVVEHQPEVIQFFEGMVEAASHAFDLIAPLARELASALGVAVEPLLKIREVILDTKTGAAILELKHLKSDRRSTAGAVAAQFSNQRDPRIPGAIAAAVAAQDAKIAEAEARVRDLQDQYARFQGLRPGATGPGAGGSGFFPTALQALERARQDAERRREERRRRELLELVALHQSGFGGPPEAGPLAGAAPVADGNTLEADHELTERLKNLQRLRLELQSGFQGPPGAASLATAAGPPQIGDANDIIARYFPQESLERTRSGVEGIGAALQELRARGEDSFGQLHGATLEIADSLTYGISQGIGQVTTDWENAGKIFEDVGKDILRTLSSIIARLVATRLLGAAIGAFSGPNNPEINNADLGAGGHGPVAGFNAVGTPATRGPTIAGEAGPEAVIPLPGDRKVPVRLEGGSGGGSTIIINAIDTQSLDEAFRGSIARQRDFVARVNAHAFQGSAALRGKYR